MAGQRGAATGAIGNDLKALVQQLLVPDLAQGPPLGLNVIVVIGDVGIVHIHPEANGAGEAFPHALVLPDALFTLLDERLQTVFLDLLLAVQTQLLLHLQLDGETVGIPARLTGNHLALHGAVAGNHILDNTGQHVADMGLTIGRGRAVVEGVGLPFLALLQGLLEDLILSPELQHLALTLYKIHIGRYFLVHLNTSKQ